MVTSPQEQQGHLSPRTTATGVLASLRGHSGDAGGSTRREENMKKEKALLVGGSDTCCRPSD